MEKLYPGKQSGKVLLIIARCFKNKKLLRENRYKHFVLESLAFLVEHKRIWLYGYVLLENEIYVLLQQRPPFEGNNVRQQMLRHVSRLIKYDMRARNTRELERYRSKLSDRMYQFWEKEKMRVEVTNMTTAMTMLENMHETPVKLGWCREQGAYPYSSSYYYESYAEPEGIPLPELTVLAKTFQFAGGEGPPDQFDARPKFVLPAGCLFKPRPVPFKGKYPRGGKKL